MPENDMIIRLSRRKEDVFKANDYKTLFSSEWPVLKVIHSGIIYKGAKVGETIHEHNLGYRPFHMIWRKPEAPPSFASGAYAEEKNDALDIFAVNEKKLYVTSAESGTDTDADHYYTILDLDINKDFTAPTANPGKSPESSSQDRDFTFKVTTGAPVSSNDSREFSVNSERQPILVHRVINHVKTVGGGETIKFSHNLGYPPAFYVFTPVADGDGYYLMPMVSSSGVLAYANTQDLFLRVVPPLLLSIVILKDPIL